MAVRAQLIDHGFVGDELRLNLLESWLIEQEIDRLEDLIGQQCVA